MTLRTKAISGLSAVLVSEPAAVQAAALRYAPAHIRSGLLGVSAAAGRAARGAARAAPQSRSKGALGEGGARVLLLGLLYR